MFCLAKCHFLTRMYSYIIVTMISHVLAEKWSGHGRTGQTPFDTPASTCIHISKGKGVFFNRENSAFLKKKGCNFTQKSVEKG